MNRRKSDEDAEDWMYPNYPPCIEAIAITKQQLKGVEMKCELQAVTNVPNLALLTPEAWTQALFNLLLEMHGGDYDKFRSSCTSAVQAIKLELSGGVTTFREAA